MPRDPLQDLLQRAMGLQKRKQKLANAEAEAALRAEKRRKFEELNSAFDAERFRFLITVLPRFSGMELSAIRKIIDDEAERACVRDLSAHKRAKVG